MIQQAPFIDSPRGKLLLKFAVAILVVVYLVNCFTPLRLHVDMLRYFAIKDCIEHGCPPDSVAAKDYLPYGYTGLLLVLSKLGILTSFTLVLINCIYLFTSIFLLIRIFGAAMRPLLFITLVLLNWAILKFAAHPLSEMQYLFLSVCSIYFFSRYLKTKKLIPLFFAFVFCGLSFLTRTVGVTLVAALVAGLIWEQRKQLMLLIRKNKIIALGLLLLIISVFVFSRQLGLTHYTGVFSKQFKEGTSFGTILQWHTTEWAEISLNTSQNRILEYVPSAVGKISFILLGAIFFCVFLFTLLRKRNIPFFIKAYVFFYSILMFTWPFYDPRFWVPLIPILIAVLTQADLKLNKNLRIITLLSGFVYVAFGLIAIGYFTYTSLDKKVMAQKHANGVYRNEYETLFFGKPATDTAKKTDTSILSVLKRYN